MPPIKRGLKMVSNLDAKKYEFTSYFFKVFKERTGFDLTEDNQAYILSVCNTCKPHAKIDDKGRSSEYFTMRLEDRLITVVCDGKTHKIITVIIETHHRKEFAKL